jgi:hypothetical protein
VLSNVLLKSKASPLRRTEAERRMDFMSCPFFPVSEHGSFIAHKSLHPPEYLMTAAMVRDAIKGASCRFKAEITHYTLDGYLLFLIDPYNSVSVFSIVNKTHIMILKILYPLHVWIRLAQDGIGVHCLTPETLSSVKVWGFLLNDC